MHCPRRITIAASLFLGAGALTATTAHAIPADVVGGQTSVLLDTELLESAAGLTLSGISDDVIAPGNLGADSVAFGINSRSATAPLLPTTFTYDSDAFAPFSGTIEHLGSVLFNDDAIEVGNFTIGFDDARIPSGVSGFFVESTVGLAGILFDIAPTAVTPTASSLDIAGDLLVSAEFADILGNAALTGADVGDALVEADAQADAGVPVPTTLALFALGLAGLGLQRQRSRGAA
jgi:hypothetical protein